MNRSSVIEEICNNPRNTLPDLRMYDTSSKILNRRLEIQKSLRDLPSGNNGRQNRKTIQLLKRESRLLYYKYLLYIKSEELPDNLERTRFLVEGYDRAHLQFHGHEREEKSRKYRNRQNVILLHLMHLKSSDEEVRQYCERLCN